jgi:putative acetyltransferase
MTLQIRRETSADHRAVSVLNEAAFGSDQESRLVEKLREQGFSRVSLIAAVNARIVGHILFSTLRIETDSGPREALSLAPMCVEPDYQRLGIGSALVRRGLDDCRQSGHEIVLVLGHPAFYSRFGFSSTLAETLHSPFGGGDAWMACELVPRALVGVVGRVVYPPPFFELE